MTASFFSTVSRRFRSFSAGLCLFAVTLQVAWPALHAGHEQSHLPMASMVAESITSSNTSLFDDHDSRHDAASCPVCRIASQLKSLTAPTMFARAVTVLAASIAARGDDALRSWPAVRAGPSRAPPLLS
jgi:predicted acylesterase/phospholipase RssA